MQTASTNHSEPSNPLPPDQFIPEEHLPGLFDEVQSKRIFLDYRTFSDCIALYEPQQILDSYHQEKVKPDFDLKAFVLKNFQLPSDPAKNFKPDPALSVEDHMKRLWPILTRQTEPQRSSLIPLPYPYVVPGGRFREIYYWDSYFTMLGLQESAEIKLIENMVDNFTYLISQMGYIPNGNRTYYLSRSQPPYYALMLNILGQEKGKEVLKKYAPALRKEYGFWMDGADSRTETDRMWRRVVKMPDGTILNRYWDDKPTPRSYAYEKDINYAKLSNRDPEKVYRGIRAACESGWDFSSRWLADEKSFHTIRTHEIIPVDLNCLLYYMEMMLSEMAGLEQDKKQEDFYRERAEIRKQGILKYCWNSEDGFFHDYDIVKGSTTDILTLAGVFPLHFNIAETIQAEKVALNLEARFLKRGGLLTTLNHTGQQWDAPNGWAPMQWISIQGLRNYGYDKLADTVTSNWTTLNIGVYKRTGKLMEKYNVEDVEIEGGGGDYPNQDGFGWTNGVLLKLLSKDKEKEAVEK